MQTLHFKDKERYGCLAWGQTLADNRLVSTVQENMADYMADSILG